MLVLYGIARGFLVISWLLIFLVYSFLISIFLTGKRKIIFYTKTTSWFTKYCLKFLNVSLTVDGVENLKSFSNGLIVSNHLSYIDILILSSLKPSIFISSVEVKKTLLLGFITKMGGSIFVERRSKSSILKDIKSISDILKDGFSVVLFPEGTTGNGDRVLNFKKSLFISAVNSMVPVLPVCLKYISVGGKKINNDNRDKVYYYGDIKFLPHFFKLLFVGDIKVKVDFMPVINLDESSCRKELSQRAYDLISFCYSK